MNRRDFIHHTSVLTLAAATSSLLAACTKTLNCEDTTGLDEPSKAMRTALKYVDKSPEPAKLCSGCNFYSAAAADACGGCTLLKGKIHPSGYCSSWIAKT